jgi:hypothetical protein
MLRDALLHAGASALTLVLVTALGLAVAWLLGPEAFGRFATLQALGAMLAPLVALRLDTRVAACDSATELQDVLAGSVGGALGFSFVGLTVAAVCAIAQPDVVWLVLAVMTMAVLSCLLDAWVNGLAFLGLRNRLLVYRTGRQVLPVAGACAAVAVKPTVDAASLGWVFGAFVCAAWAWLSLPVQGPLTLVRWRRSWVQHRHGLSASLSLGVLNTVWLNGLLPALQALGLSAVAGQYALVQRLLGAPLGVVSVTLNALLMKSSNVLHRQPWRLLGLALGLFVLALTTGAFIHMASIGVLPWQLPERWRMEGDMFWPAVFFLSASFAVGGLSIVSIRLKDEWFLTGWQAVALASWVGVLLLMPSVEAFRWMLLLGGCAYGVLLLRWVWRAQPEMRLAP